MARTRQKLVDLSGVIMKAEIKLYASICALFFIRPAFGQSAIQSFMQEAAVPQQQAGQQISTQTLETVSLSSGVFISSSTSALDLSTAPSIGVQSQSSAPSRRVPSVSVRGVHITSWVAGTSRARRRFLKKMEGTVLTAIVVAVKETDGKVYIPGVKTAHWLGSYTPAISKPEEMLRDIKTAGLRSIARIVVFADNYLPRIRPDLAVKNPDDELWTTYNGTAWADPYMKKVWEYNADVAVRAAELGFDEIQFDYIRFPADGATALCRYAKPYSQKSATAALSGFLLYAKKRLAFSKTPVSVALFGLTTTVKGDMGIGQKLLSIASIVDYISPMMYPSHYARGEYGIENPNLQPYKIINLGLKDAVKRLKENSHKLRPYLQDFSRGYRYGPVQVKAQILAAKENGVTNWILWNPQNNYSWEALEVPKEQ